MSSSSQPVDATARVTATPRTDKFRIQVVIPIISFFVQLCRVNHDGSVTLLCERHSPSTRWNIAWYV